MNRNNSKKFFQTLASLVGVASASALLSVPAFALPNSSSRSTVISEAPEGTLYSQASQRGPGQPTGGSTGTSGQYGGTSTDGTQQYQNDGTTRTQQYQNDGTTRTQQYYQYNNTTETQQNQNGVRTPTQQNTGGTGTTGGQNTGGSGGGVRALW